MEKEILIEAVEKVYEEKLSKVVGFLAKYKDLRCSFCGKSQNDVEKIIAGNHVYICNECVEICCEILDDKKPEQ